jgi:nicotinate phosphoribosyltransferase
VLKVRGRYRDFANLETPTLGVFTRCSRVATNVHEVLEAARGKPVLFFPARFDTPEVQASDGYSYDIAVQAFNQEHGLTVESQVSTDAQGDWWGGAGGGTTAHAIIACFLGDTAEMMRQFCATLPASVSRVALVDFNNDCVRDTLAVMKTLFAEYLVRLRSGDLEGAACFKLAGVRADTGASMRDVSVEPIGSPEADLEVNPRLVFRLRSAIDSAWELWGLAEDDQEIARRWCREVAVTVTGGFNARKIRLFERLGVPVSGYGVGSSLFSNDSEHGTNTDFTADIVRVKIEDSWHDMAKVGRRASDNPLLERVGWSELSG